MDEHNKEPRVAPQPSEDVNESKRIGREPRRTWQRGTICGMVIAALALVLTVIFVSRTVVLSGKLSALEGDISQLEEDTSQLEESISQLEENTSQLEEDISQLEEDISQLEAENATLSAEVQQLEEEVSSYSVLLKPASDGSFDDALFIGDSVSNKLELYAEGQRAAGQDCLDNAQFLTADSMGWTNSLDELGADGSVHASYQGEEMMLEDAVAASGAKKIFIMLGINDIASYGVDTVIDSVDTSCQRILEKNPDTVIYLESVTPIVEGSQTESLNNSKVAEFNAALQEYCLENGFYYVDVASVVSDGNGNLREDYCSDIDDQGIHFTDEACEIWIDCLREHTGLSAEDQQLEEADAYSVLLEPAPDGFFDDALFIGDSLSVKLESYVGYQRDAGYDCLDNAQFFAEVSMGWANSLNEIGSIYAIHASYHGQEMMLEDAVAASGAKKVYIMLGINDIAGYGVDAVIGYVDTSCQRILEKNPDTVIFLESVTPIVYGNQRDSFNNSMVARFNEILQAYCQENGFYYLDVASVVSDGNGNLREDYCSDISSLGIHFNDKACEVWVEYLQEHPYGL